MPQQQLFPDYDSVSDSEEQCAPITLSNGMIRRLLIRASAGTGKTFQLSSRYLSLLRISSPEKILASTFTRKAAGEILERILIRLARAAIDSAELKELQKHVGSPPLKKQECLQMLSRLTRELHRVRIGTLDSFFSRLAGSYSLELGLPPGWRMLDEIEAGHYRDQAIDSLLRHSVQQDIVQLMHLLAKGESTRSVSTLLTRTVDDFYQLYLNTSADSWNQFPDFHFVDLETRNEIIAKIQALPLDGKRLTDARDKDCSVFRSNSWLSMVESGLMPKVINDETYYRKPLPDPLVELYRQLIPHLRAEVIAPWKHQTTATRDLLTSFHKTFESIKQFAKGLLFDDITRKLQTFSSLSTNGHPFRLDAAIEHILLDEFQDTSPAQWSVIRQFAERVCHEPEQSFFCVGDTKQAIYGWRGGEAAIFDAIEKHLPGLTTQSLDTSYRSSPVIMDAVNQIMMNIHRHDDMEDYSDALHHWAKNFPQHSTTRKDLPGFVRVLTAAAPPQAETGDDTQDDRNQALYADTARYVEELTKSAPTASIGILTRTNAAVGKLIYELQQRGLDASEEGGNPLTDSAAVEYVLSLLTLADHPGHRIACFHVATSPLGKIVGFEDFENSAEAHRLSLHLRTELLHQGYGKYVDWLTTQLASYCSQRELRRLMQLTASAEEYDARLTTLRATDFVEYARKQRRDEPSAARIRVMNIHQSKGLEFDIVVLPQLDSLMVNASQIRYVKKTSAPGESPDLVALSRNKGMFDFIGGDLFKARQQTLDGMIQESLCVLYVALTRAVHSLHMIFCPTVRKSLPKSFSGLISAALEIPVASEPNRILYEAGDPNWASHLTPPEILNQAEQPSTATEELTPIKFAERSSSRHRARVAPSQLKSSGLVQMKHLLHAPDAQALKRGSLFHRWLEELEWITSASLNTERLKQIGNQWEPDETQLKNHLSLFADELHQHEIKDFLTLESYQQRFPTFFPDTPEIAQRSNEINYHIRRELPFAFIDQGQLVNGKIDRLLIASLNGQIIAANVIDFKTDRIQADSRAIQEKEQVYLRQMLAYREAVTQIYSLPPERIAGHLVFLQAGRVQLVYPN